MILIWIILRFDDYLRALQFALMSFRDAFTRGSSSENLRYDDAAAYHFYMTVLIIVGLPLGWSILKTITNPFSHIPTLSELEKKRQFRDKIAKFKKENKYGFITFRFVLKVLIFGFIVYSMIICTRTILQAENQIKGFDPYEILQVENNAPVQKIKKAYRKLALLYHPDRNPDNPEASAKFIIISKAYECLTDEQAKEKCLKYGNPDGSSSFNVGIALPQFLVKKQNHLAIMGVVFLLVVIVLPIYLIHYHSQMNKYDDFGMLSENAQYINFAINQQFGIKDAIKMVACCAQFANMPTTSPQIPKLEVLLRQLSEEQRRALTKKNFKGFIKKCLLLIDARLNEKEVASELQEDYKYIMKKTPAIIKSSIHSACERSSEMVKGQPYFIGKLCIYSLILFQQYFIQGRSYEFADSFTQLDLSEEQIDKITKKKKNKKLMDLKNLIDNEEDRNSFLSLLDSNRSTYIKECIEYFPTVDVQCDFKVDDENQIGAGDFFQIIVTLKSNRLSNFCSAVDYPFLKKEGWHLILSDSNSIAIIFHEFFNFDDLTKTFKATYRQQKQGRYTLNLKLMSDCYFGLDVQKEIRYEVGQKKQNNDKDNDEQQVQEDSYIRKIFNSLVPQQQQEVSDEEDKDLKQKKEKSEKVQTEETVSQMKKE